MSILPPGPESNSPSHQPTVIGVARMMIASPDQFTREVGSLIHYIGEEHTRPVTCGTCDDGDDPTPCPVYENALSIAIAWLLKVVDERG